MPGYFKKIIVLILAAALTLFSGCDLLFSLMENTEPQESFVPQTYETADYKVPIGQNTGIKPCFYGDTPDIVPVRPLEQAESTYHVKTEQQLIDCAMSGRRPVFSEGSQLRILYNTVLKVLNTIIRNDMTEVERALAIYDFIIFYTVYDFELLDKFVNHPETLTGTENSFNLKGVFFDQIAVCDGFSKAFSLMCSIEGITNVIITGDASDEKGNYLPHAWNKIRLDGIWYAVDTTYGNIVLPDKTEYLTHHCFLVSDASLGHREEKIESANMFLLSATAASINYNFYAKTKIKGYVTLLEPNGHNYIFNEKKELGKYSVFIKLRNIETIEIYSTLDPLDFIDPDVNFGSHKRSEIAENTYLIIF